MSSLIESKDFQSGYELSFGGNVFGLGWSMFLMYIVGNEYLYLGIIFSSLFLTILSVSGAALFTYADYRFAEFSKGVLFAQLWFTLSGVFSLLIYRVN